MATDQKDKVVKAKVKSKKITGDLILQAIDQLDDTVGGVTVTKISEKLQELHPSLEFDNAYIDDFLEGMSAWASNVMTTGILYASNKFIIHGLTGVKMKETLKKSRDFPRRFKDYLSRKGKKKNGPSDEPFDSYDAAGVVKKVLEGEILPKIGQVEDAVMINGKGAKELVEVEIKDLMKHYVLFTNHFNAHEVTNALASNYGDSNSYAIEKTAEGTNSTSVGMLDKNVGRLIQMQKVGL